MSRLKYKPLNLGRWLIWGGTALVMIALPQIFTSGFTLTLMSQIGVGIIFALSYNMLLGQGGMLSFGHDPSPVGFVFGHQRIEIAPRRHLAHQVEVTQQAASLHLKVLEEAGLVEARREGTRHLYSILPSGFQPVESFVSEFWGDRLGDLKSEIERK